MNKIVKINNFQFSNDYKLNLIAGPCVLESLVMRKNGRVHF